MFLILDIFGLFIKSCVWIFKLFFYIKKKVVVERGKISIIFFFVGSLFFFSSGYGFFWIYFEVCGLFKILLCMFSGF